MSKFRLIPVAIGLMMCHPLSRVSAHEGDSTETSSSIAYQLGEDAGIFLSDASSFFSAPLHFSGQQWLYAAGVAGGTGLLMASDQEIKDRVGRNTVNTLNGDFWDIPTRYGVVQYANIFSIATYATGLLAGSDDIRVTGRLLFESLSLSGVSVIVLRAIAGRSRPYSGDGPWKFNWFTLDNNLQSFPSGHTVVAFALSTVFAERLDNVWARIGFYGMASLTAFARVYNNQHWFSDVVTGAALGLAAGLHVMANECQRQRQPQGDTPGLSFYPSIQGLHIVYRF